MSPVRGSLPGKYTVWEHRSRLPGAPQPHLSSLPALLFWSPLPPSCYSPPASVPKERHSHPPPIPLASRSAGRQVRAVCSPQTSPDRRLLVGPRSEPCRSSRPTTSCFQTIPQSESPGLKGEVCPLLSWKPGWQRAQRKILFLSSQMRSHFRQVGQRQATGWWGWEGFPRAEVDPQPQSLDLKGAQWASDRTCHRAQAARQVAGPGRSVSPCRPPSALLSLATLPSAGQA